MAVITVGTVSELQNAFQTAADGDTIEMQAGDYGDITFRDRSFSQGITITSADSNDPARFDFGFGLKNVDGITFTDVIVERTSMDPADYSTPLVTINGCTDVTLTDMQITGYLPTTADGVDPNDPATTRMDPIVGLGYDTGLRILGGGNDQITIDNVEFSDLRVAALLESATNVIATNNDVHNVREGFDLCDLDNAFVSGNYFHDFDAWWPNYPDGSGPHDHPDMIQYWGMGGSTGLNNIMITNNLFHQAEGLIPTQSIFGHMRTAPTGLTATNFTISNNVIINNHPNAISMADVQGFDVSNNLLLPNSPDATITDGFPKIYIQRSTDGNIDGNVVPELPGMNGAYLNLTATDLATDNIDCGDNLPLSWSTASVNYCGDAFASIASDPMGLISGGTPYIDVITEALGIVIGDGVATTLTAGDTGAMLVGTAIDETLVSGDGSDDMMGGGGSDTFEFDVSTAPLGPTTDTIQDLNFGAGDRIVLIAGPSVTFDDSLDPTNDLQTGSNGSVTIDSLADLRELVASGQLNAVDATDGSGLILTLPGAPDAAVKLSGYSILSLQMSRIQIGSAGNDSMRAAPEGSVMYGMDGNDRLTETGGSDNMWGGSGADLFIIDFRSPDAVGSRDVIWDLQFAQGDRVSIIVATDGTFDDTYDPSNVMKTNASGDIVWFNSLADVKEAVDSGALIASVGSASGGLLLSEAQNPANAIEIAGMTMADLGLAAPAPVNTPASIAGTDTGTAAEDQAGAVTGQLTITDPDAGEDAFNAQTGTGAYGSFTIAADGSWSYMLNNADPAVQALVAGQSVTETFSVTSVDGTSHQVTVTVQGADDGAVITGSDTGTVAEDVTLAAQGQLSVADPDAGEAAFNAQTGTGTYGSFDLAADGSWNYALNNADPTVQALVAGQTVTDSFTVTSIDGTSHQVTLTITGQDEAATVPTPSPSPSLVITGTSGADTLRATDAGAQLEGLAGNDKLYERGGNDILIGGAGADSFIVDVRNTASGQNLDVIRDLNFGEGDTLQIITGVSGTFTDSSDPGNRLQIWSSGGTAKFNSLADLSEAIASGALSYDSSVSDSLVLRVVTDPSRAIEISSITPADLGLATSTPAPVNTPASIAGADTGTADEDQAAAVTGQLTIADPDAGEAAFNAQIGTGTYGSFDLAAGGSWSYALNNADPVVQALAAGQSVTDSFTVTSIDGTTHQVTVTVQGTNDGAVIGGTDTGVLTEDQSSGTSTASSGGVMLAAAPTPTGTAVSSVASGQLTITDPDAGEAAFAAQTNTGVYGSLDLAADGSWSYTLNNTDPAVQALGAGQSVTDSFTVTSVDGTTHQVNMTVHGDNDGAVITGTDTGTVVEDQTTNIAGQLSIADPDAGEAAFAVQTDTGTYGSFDLAADGSWSYALNNADPAVQALGAGQTVIDSFTVTSVDGTSHQVNVTVQGSFDGAVISGTQGNDMLRATKGGAWLQGLDGNDTLYERAGDDFLSGGDGADRFIIDMRNQDQGAGTDIIEDLDFSQGDRLQIITGVDGTFDDSADLINSMKTWDNGGTVSIDSLEDLAEAINSGALIHDDSISDRLVVSISTDTDRSIEILNITEEDLASL